MGTTTSNQDLGITTKTSDHAGKTQGPTDVNWNPPKQVTVPHENEAATVKASEHTTSKTQFSGGEVVCVGDAIAPTSAPVHPDTGGGVVSGTYINEARITSGSPNVKAEGKPIGRDTDPTTQNHANTVGKMEGSDPTATVKELEAEKLLACSLDTTKATCGHGRVAGKEHFLEIIASDSVVLEATRKNAKTSGPPACTKPPHTKWKIKRVKNGKVEKQEEKSGDSITLDNAWFTWGSLDLGKATAADALATGDSKHELKTNDRTKQHYDQAYKELKPRKSGRKATEKRRAGATAAAEQTQGKFEMVQVAVDAYTVTTSIVDFFKVWNAGTNPVEVTVEAFACSGADKYVLRSYPGKEIELDLADSLKKLSAALQTVAKVFRGIQKLANLAGIAAKANVTFLQKMNAKCSCVWEEMTKDVPAIKKYKHHVDRGWAFELSGILAKTEDDELVFAMPIAIFANLFVPGAGSALNSALNFIGFEANIGFEITLKISMGIWGERKPGDLAPTFGGGFPIELALYARVAVRWKSAVNLSGGVNVTGSPKLVLQVPTIDLFSTLLKLEAGELKIGFKGVAKVDLYFWEYNWSGEYYPEGAKVSWSEFGMKLFALLKQ